MILTIELPSDLDEPLKAQAEAHGLSTDQYVRQVLESGLRTEFGRRRHISEVICERMRNIPPEAWANVPTDGASEHDHYIHGLPKRNV